MRAASRFLWLTCGASVLMAGAKPAVGGGDMRRDPEFEAREAKADETARRWEKRGVAASSEMLAAICRRDDLLAPRATELFEGLGHEALAPLLRAAANPDALKTSAGLCDIEGTLASVMCGAQTGQAELAGMLADRRPELVKAGLRTLESIVDTEYGHHCGPRAEFVAAALPALRVLLRTRSGKVLEETTWTVHKIGPDAAPLVPDLIPILDKEDIAGNGAAMALETIGPAAAPAIPKLTMLLRQGGKWRSRAIEVFGRIGPAAAATLPDFVPVLKASAPGVCRNQPRYSEDDAIVFTVLRAAARIGGRGVEPLVPDLVALFPRMRACGIARPDDWLKAFGAFGEHGKAASDMLLAMVEDPDESLRVREQALEALDATGPRLTWWWRLRRTRAAFEHKRKVFAPPPRSGGVPQVLPPEPPPPLVPPELALCRAEAGLPPSPPHPDPPTLLSGNRPFGDCVRARLCGPDQDAYRATLAKCCRSYQQPLPWFCATR